MSIEYEKRKSLAEEINKELGHLGVNLVIIGSVAYNPEAVTTESDLDLLGLCDFTKIDFMCLYQILNIPSDPNVINNAQKRIMNNVSLVWNNGNFEIGLHLWDFSAFENVVNLTSYNTTFRSNTPDGVVTQLQARTDSQIFTNLSGHQKEVNKEPKEAPGGTVLKFFPYIEADGEFYPNIQIYNLLLSPVILSTDQREYIEHGIQKMRSNLREKLISIYGGFDESRNLLIPLPNKIQNKLSEASKRELLNFSMSYSRS